MDGIKRDYGRKINFVYVDMDQPEGKQRARDEGVMGTPTFLLLDSAGERVDILQGVHSRATMERHLDALLNRQ